jgi:hypothetical protein
LAGLQSKLYREPTRKAASPQVRICIFRNPSAHESWRSTLISMSAEHVGKAALPAPPGLLLKIPLLLTIWVPLRPPKSELVRVMPKNLHFKQVLEVLNDQIVVQRQKSSALLKIVRNSDVQGSPC